MKRLMTGAALLVATPAFAHVGGDGCQHHLAAGFFHPFSGLDHMLAMIAVGLCAAMLGGFMRLTMPATFLGAMLAGFFTGSSGYGVIPAHEAMIVASVIGFGLVLTLARPLPSVAALAATALFGVAHGFAHGLEGAATPGFVAGFLAATAVLHGLGLAAGLIGTHFNQAWLYRVSGGALTVAGVALALT